MATQNKTITVMNFEEMQKAWNSVKSEPKSDEEILRMMYAPHGWRFRGLTRKEVWGLTWNGLVIVALIVVFEPFRSTSSTIWFIVSLLLGILQDLNQFFGLRYLRFFPQKDTIQETLK